MILWHLGATTLAVRYVYRDPAMDLRWVMAGSLLPDLIDKPIGAVLFNGTFHAHRLVAHAVVFPVALFLGVLVLTGRGAVRKRLIGLVIGALFHLVLDAAWADPEAFFWPLFGWEFPPSDPSALGPLLAAMVRDPLVWVGEAAGGAYLVWLWAARLRPSGGLRRLLRTGTVPLPVREAG
ncbi:MAG: metal-dependent hydrolase, partial [Actinobacteria bacterium]|nr:metal-dependent hydrolase [Actinomycetota bacterium]